MEDRLTEKTLMEHIRERITKNPYYHQIKDKTEKETIINDLFVNVWLKIKNGEMSDKWEDIKGYVFISGRNNCLSYLRKRKEEREKLVSIDADEEYNNYKYNPDTERVEFHNVVEEKLKFMKEELFDEDLKVMMLRIKGYTLKEIGDMLGKDIMEMERINRNMIRYLRNRWTNKYHFDAVKKKYGSLANLHYKVIDTKGIEEPTIWINKTELAAYYGVNKHRINEYVCSSHRIDGRYRIKILTNWENI